MQRGHSQFLITFPPTLFLTYLFILSFFFDLSFFSSSLFISVFPPCLSKCPPSLFSVSFLHLYLTLPVLHITLSLYLSSIFLRFLYLPKYALIRPIYNCLYMNRLNLFCFYEDIQLQRSKLTCLPSQQTPGHDFFIFNFVSLFVPKDMEVSLSAPRFYFVFTIFGRMPGIEPELLRPQPGMLPMSYSHPY